MFAEVTKDSIDLPVKYSEISHRRRAEVRLAYIIKQNGICMHCKEKLTDKPSFPIRRKKIHLKLFPVNFFEYPVHLHHDHKTDLTIGAVHCLCNAVLWEYHNE